MNTRQIPVILIVLALLGVSAGTALAGGTWYGGEGQLEPSTIYDTGDFMQQYPNDASHPDGMAERVYFNGMLLNEGSGTNVEGGTLRSGLTTFGALLGFWRDCNGDGYVGAKNSPAPYGNFNTGLYPADVYPIDTTLCEPNSAYNRGDGWVDEFRWIGPGAQPSGESVATQQDCGPNQVFACNKQWGDPWDVSDPDAKVWGDWNRPDSRGARTGSFTPAYLFQNSSGTLRYVNWFVGADAILEAERTTRIQDPQNESNYLVNESYRLAEKGTWNSTPNFGDCGGDYSTFRGGPGFAGTGQGTCGMYPLYQVTRLENDSDRDGEEAQPLVRVYDTEKDEPGEDDTPCDDTSLPTGEQMADVEPGVSSNPLMDGSVGGTRHNVETGTGNLQFDGECRASDPNNSGTGEDPAPEGKRRVDTEFSFHRDKRFQTARAAGVEYVPADALGVFGGPTSPGGSDWILFETSAGPRWLGSPGYVTVSRVPTLQQPDFATFYADVGLEALSVAGGSSATALPAGSQDAHTYGSDTCDSFDDTNETRVANDYFWVCSAEEWPSKAYYPGIPYDLRDVDCYDNSPIYMEVADGVVVDGRWQDVQAPTGEMIRSSCADWWST